jgi:1-acyl-sn-glycerol-3-phosphate acyltransferase
VARPRLGFAYGLTVMILRPIMMVLTKRDWHGAEHIPATGGFVVAPNHVSNVDPIAFAHFLYDNGRLPRFLAKSSLFSAPVVGWVVRNSGQIPVFRESRDATHAISGAVKAIDAGECVAVYPEGTITRDPGLWPMIGKTGAARIALTTGAPVIPVAQWGPEQLLPYQAQRPKFFPRKTMHVTAGPPVELDDLRGLPITPEVLRQATERIMQDITKLLAGIRHETPPAIVFDPRTAGLSRTGRPIPGELDGAEVTEPAGSIDDSTP